MQKNEKTEHIKIKTGLCACVNTPYGLSKKEVVILGRIGIHTYTGTHHTHTHTHTNTITATCYPIIPFDQSGNGKSCGDLSLIQTHGKDIKSSMR